MWDGDLALRRPIGIQRNGAIETKQAIYLCQNGLVERIGFGVELVCCGH